MTFQDCKVSKFFDDERGKNCALLEVGRWQATGFYHEGDVSLDEDEVNSLIRELEKIRREL